MCRWGTCHYCTGEKAFRGVRPAGPHPQLERLAAYDRRYCLHPPLFLTSRNEGGRFIVECRCGQTFGPYPAKTNSASDKTATQK